VKRAVKVVLVAVIGFAVMIATGYASDKIKYSGFLTNYPTFEKGPKGGVDWRYIKPGADFKKYNKIMLDEVTFFLRPDSKYKGIQAEEMKELSEAFHQAAVKELQGAYPLVKEPGPDVMRVRVAITELQKGHPGMNVVSTVMPIGLGISIIKKGVTGKWTGVGGAGMEVEFLDSVTNERIAAAIDEKSGSKVSGMTTFGSAKEAFEFWAGRLRTFLDQAHGMGK
jgi:hypothetical protein